MTDRFSVDGVDITQFIAVEDRPVNWLQLLRDTARELQDSFDLYRSDRHPMHRELVVDKARPVGGHPFSAAWAGETVEFTGFTDQPHLVPGPSFDGSGTLLPDWATQRRPA